MSAFLFHHAKLFDPRCDELVEGVEVLVEQGRVKEVSRPDGPVREPIHTGMATRINLEGRTLMPGLIDAHVHIFLSKLPLAVLESMPLTTNCARGPTTSNYWSPAAWPHPTIRSRASSFVSMKYAPRD